MIDLSKFLINPFLDERFSFGDKQRFSEEHIGRLTAQNTSGQYNTLLSDTLTAHSDYFGDFTNVKIKEAVQQSLTQVVDKILEDFMTRTSRLNNFLIATEVNKNAIYQEFFPLGVTEFTKDTNKTNADSHIARLVAAITAHTTEAGGTSVLAEYIAFQDNYAKARTNQLIKKGDTEGNRTTRDEKGTRWADVLFSNLLVIANQFRNKPEKLSDFFDQSILRPQSKADNDGKGQLSGMVTNAATSQPEAGVTIHVVDAKISDAHSKADGSYRTQRLPVGVYSVIVSKQGFTSQTLQTTVVDEGDTTLDVQL